MISNIRLRTTWCILAMVFLCTACTRGVVIEENVTFSAVVLKVDKMSLLVEPLEGERERSSSDQIQVSLKDDDSKVLEEIRQGDTVEITYDGLISESYPARISGAFGIKVTEHAE